MLRLRRLAPRDAALLAPLARAAFRATFAGLVPARLLDGVTRQRITAARLRRALAAPGAAWTLAVEDGVPVGYAGLSAGEAPPCVRGQRPLELERLYLLPAAIGRGVGRRLMAHAMREARRRRAGVLWLLCWEKNARALRFYRRAGFRSVGRRDIVVSEGALRRRLVHRVMAASVPRAP